MQRIISLGSLFLLISFQSQCLLSVPSLTNTTATTTLCPLAGMVLRLLSKEVRARMYPDELSLLDMLTFLYSYINHKNIPALRGFFPNVRLEELDAGHWGRSYPVSFGIGLVLRLRW